MAAMHIKMSCALLSVMVLVALWSPVAEAVTCGEVVSAVAVAPCLGYLRNGGAPPRSASSSYRGVSGNYAASLRSQKIVWEVDGITTQTEPYVTHYDPKADLQQFFQRRWHHFKYY
ncbi:hypothetical protein OSB04_022783 [Centaurea solstitialis]|uniref:Uncharacterized protein n=1 Tax=Centaurea solstitialis TaxID=347529 RepID=A0AA38SW80_9ASTR|nr:hypothetical protein OSB04_022783 [Centaurea solstitialis]